MKKKTEKQTEQKLN